MHLQATPATTLVLPDQSAEEDFARRRLMILDPKAMSHYEYREGTWDGYHCFDVGNDQEIRFPTGLLGWFQGEAKHAGFEVSTEFRSWVEVEPHLSPFPEILAGVSLRDYQVTAMHKALHRKRGVLACPPRSGKTEIALGVMTALNVPSLLLVNRANLALQHAQRAADRGVEVQVLGAGKKLRAPLPMHLIAMVGSLNLALDKEDPLVREHLEQCLLIQGDEIHMVSDSKTWIRAFLACNAPYRLGYSGTPFRDKSSWNAKDFWLRGVTGPIIFEVDPEFLAEQGFLVLPQVFMIQAPGPDIWNLTDWQQVYVQGLVENEPYNRLVVRNAIQLARHGLKTMISCVREDHGKILLRLLHAAGIPSMFCRGNRQTLRYDGFGYEKTTMGLAAVERIFREELPIMVGSTVYDQGVDFPFLGATVVAGGWESALPTVQRGYRPMTANEDKERAVIVDYNHSFSRVLRRHSKSRCGDYRAALLGGKLVQEVSPDEFDRIWS